MNLSFRCHYKYKEEKPATLSWSLGADIKWWLLALAYNILHPIHSLPVRRMAAEF